MTSTQSVIVAPTSIRIIRRRPPPELTAPSSPVLPDNNEWRKTLPTLENANSMPVTLANVMETSDNAGNRSQNGSADDVCAADGVHEPEANLAGTGAANAGRD
jgi:hypothetical protein